MELMSTFRTQYLDPETGNLLNDVFEEKEDNKTFDSDREQPKLPKPKPKDDLRLMGQKRREDKEEKFRE